MSLVLGLGQPPHPHSSSVPREKAAGLGKVILAELTYAGFRSSRQWTGCIGTGLEMENQRFLFLMPCALLRGVARVKLTACHHSAAYSHPLKTLKTSPVHSQAPSAFARLFRSCAVQERLADPWHSLETNGRGTLWAREATCKIWAT